MKRLIFILFISSSLLISCSQSLSSSNLSSVKLNNIGATCSDSGAVCDSKGLYVGSKVRNNLNFVKVKLTNGNLIALPLNTDFAININDATSAVYLIGPEN